MTTRVPGRDLPRGVLAAGILVFATMTLILVAISEEVIRHEPLTAADSLLSTWLYAHRSPFLTSAMRVATSLGSPVTVTCLAVSLGIYLLLRRSAYWLAALVLAVPGGALLNILLKYAVHRPRPSLDDPIVMLSGYSFPSGHTMIASVLYGVIAAYLCARVQDWRRRVLAVMSAGVVIGLVGFSRIYLGAHYLTDVLAAMAEGVAWLSLCVMVVHALRQRRNRSDGAGRG